MSLDDLELQHDDPERVRSAIRTLCDRLSTGRVEDPIDAGRALIPVANHASAKVRQAVAEACEYLPDPEGEALLERLRADRNAYVKRAAHRASDRRAERKRRGWKRRTDDDAVVELLTEIETKYSKTARKLTERAIARREEMLFREIQHEVSKVLTPLLASFHRARATSDKATVGRELEEAASRVDLLTKILQSGRAYSARLEPEYRLESIAAIVDQARAQLVDRLGERHSRLTIQVDVDPKLSATVDRSALLQALQNVLQNAVEAYLEDAATLALHITARTLRGGSQLVLSVADLGAGMGPRQLAGLFQRFHTTKARGTGFGLLIARRMIEEAHGGTLVVSSELGKGTTVMMTLPARRKGAP
jgi:signal transduction histidine kinase